MAADLALGLMARMTRGTGTMRRVNLRGRRFAAYQAGELMVSGTSLTATPAQRPESSLQAIATGIRATAWARQWRQEMVVAAEYEPLLGRRRSKWSADSRRESPSPLWRKGTAGAG